ncbi:MAG: cytochrome C oxidase subunit IV family protein [Planctomycetota bacterium]|nr:cytochrome C oxidase subunit IV family protein [Planctomycetota bacterium]
MTEHDDHAHDAEHGHGSMKLYLSVFGALVVCTGISFAVGSSPMMEGELAWMGQAFMIAISCVKSLLVMLVFMHLVWEANWKYVLTIPASLMSVFLLCMLMPDVMLRTRRYAEERWRYAAEEEYPAAILSSESAGNAVEKTDAADSDTDGESDHATDSETNTGD